MAATFWAISLVMVVLASAFIAFPLLRNDRRKLAIGAAVLVPLFAAGLYLAQGSPQVTVASAAMPQTGSGSSGGMQSGSASEVGSVASMVDGLANRLRDNPDDGPGWLLLAKSYNYLGRKAEAIDAYKQAVFLGQSDPTLADLSQRPQQDANSSRISGTVSLSDSAGDLVQPSDTVFIFARASNGPNMPLAVIHRPAAELPIDFELSDSQSMSPTANLSSFEEVVVVAKISRSGVAAETLQQLEAKSEVVRVSDNQHLNLIIQ